MLSSSSSGRAGQGPLNNASKNKLKPCGPRGRTALIGAYDSEDDPNILPTVQCRVISKVSVEVRLQIRQLPVTAVRNCRNARRVSLTTVGAVRATCQACGLIEMRLAALHHQFDRLHLTGKAAWLFRVDRVVGSSLMMIQRLAECCSNNSHCDQHLFRSATE